MKMTGNTILITGGSSGIGKELARQLAKDNVVIITGRDRAKLEATRAELGNVHVAQSDVDDPNAIVVLYDTLTREFPALNVLINNAGIMRKVSLRDGADDLLIWSEKSKRILMVRSGWSRSFCRISRNRNLRPS
jgi:uncharacterized oxidoreductase